MTIETLRMYFSAFSDPATDVQVGEDHENAFIELFRSGAERKYRLQKSTGQIFDRIANRQFPSIASLFASEEYANIRGFAATQLRLSEQREIGYFVEPNMRIYGKNDTTITIEELSHALTIGGSGKTNLILLDGPAGVGKTRVLQRLEWQRAKEHREGRNVAPMLYVSSRGARLSNLRSELAASTQKLRADFTYDQVPILMQFGLLTLAIDGFDELVDADGYKDAWYALSEFLEGLNSKGSCILSGRDTFFDQQGFLNRIERAKSNLELTQVHLSSLEVSGAIKWLRDAGWSEEEIARDKTKEVLRENSYALRPYFLSELASTTGWDALSTSISARDFLIERFIEREAELIQKFTEISIDHAKNGLRIMFKEIAKDMTERESNEVDVDYLSFLCDFSFSNYLSNEEIRKIAHKAGSVGLLEKSHSERTRRFPHTEIKHHFLALSILDELSEKTVPLSLRRAVIGTDFIEVYQDTIECIAESKFTTAFQFLKAILSTEFSSDRLPQNGGAILLGSLTRSLRDSSLKLEDLQVNECRLDGPLTDSSISCSEIYRLDSRDADFQNVIFNDVHIALLIANANTSFGSTTPRIDSLQLVENSHTETMRDPLKISQWLRSRANANDTPNDDLPLNRYYERLCKKAIKQFYFKIGGDDFGSELIESEFWQEIFPILDKYNRVEIKTIPTSGRGAEMIHIKEPASLLPPFEDDYEANEIHREVCKRALELAQE